MAPRSTRLHEIPPNPQVEGLVRDAAQDESLLQLLNEQRLTGAPIWQLDPEVPGVGRREGCGDIESDLLRGHLVLESLLICVLEYGRG